MHVADLYRHVSAKHAIPANPKIGRGDLSPLDWAAFADEPGTHTLSLGHRTPLGSHPRKEDHKFLHSAAIIKHKGVMYRNCANSPSNENGPHKTLQGRRSNDDGKTWGLWRSSVRAFRARIAISTASSSDTRSNSGPSAPVSLRATPPSDVFAACAEKLSCWVKPPTNETRAAS